MKVLIILLSCMLYCNFAILSQNFISGKVMDADKKEALAFVNITINSTNQGGTTDIDGKFFLSSAEKIQYLRFSYVGYQPQVIYLNDDKPLKIELKKTEIELSEVIIHPGENPAHRIIDAAIKNRDLNNPEKQRSFSYTSYNKMIFTADQTHVENKLRDSIPLDSSEIRFRQFLDEQHIFLMESVSDRKFKYPDKNNEKIIVSRVSGFKDQIFSLLATQFQSFSFYPSSINILDKQYVNPISHGATSKYLFIIEDTAYSGIDTVFIISFRPLKGKNFEGMKGLLYINSNKYAIQNVIAEPYTPGGFFTVKIQQKYEFIDSLQWFPVQLNIDFKYTSVMINSSPVVGIGRSYINRIKLHPEFSKRDFDNTIISYNQNEKINCEEKLISSRVDSLSEKEINTYKMIDSLGQAEKLDEKLKLLKIYIAGQIPFGLVNIDIERFISFNDYEGFRFGAGVHTSNKISKIFTIGAYYGYSQRIKRSNFGGDCHIKIHKDSELEFSYLFKHNLEESGKFSTFGSRESRYDDSFRKMLIKDMFEEEKHQIKFEFRTIQYLKMELGLSKSFQKINGNYQYKIQNENVSIYFNEFNTTELSLGFKYLYKEKFMKNPDHKISLGSKYPLFWGKYSRGLQNFLGGEYEFHKFEFQANYSLKLSYFGKPSLTIQAGFIEGKVPAFLQFSGRASYRNFIYDVRNCFATMRMNEFLSDRFIAAYFRHDFGKLLLKSKYFNPDLVLVTNFGTGQLKNFINHSEITYNTMGKGFWESGLLINDLLDIQIYSLGFGAYYRYGAYANPYWKNNLALKFTFVLNI